MQGLWNSSNIPKANTGFIETNPYYGLGTIVKVNLSFIGSCISQSHISIKYTMVPYRYFTRVIQQGKPDYKFWIFCIVAHCGSVGSVIQQWQPPKIQATCQCEPKGCIKMERNWMLSIIIRMNLLSLNNHTALALLCKHSIQQNLAITFNE